jgi:DNA-binding MarR family transcriptional regulator
MSTGNGDGKSVYGNSSTGVTATSTSGTGKADRLSYVTLLRTDLARTDLTSGAKLVYADIVDRIGHNGRCWPGQRRIACDCGMTPKAANRAIAELHRRGLIE